METVVSVVKIIWIGFWAILATIVMFIPIAGAALLSKTGNLATSLSKVWAWVMVIASGVRINVRGREKIQKGQSYIIVSNHQSFYDILALVTKLGIQFRWIIKKELLKVPLFGYALYASRNVFIDRSNTSKSIASINQGLNRLPPGASILFFAEGTRSADGSIQKFKKGGFVMAVEKGMPILPVTVSGSRKILPKGSLVFNPGRMEVVVGDPIDASKYTHETIDELIDKTRNVVISNYNPAYPE